MRAAAALRAPSSVHAVRPLPSASHRAPVQAFATKAKGAASRKSAGKAEAKPAGKPKGSSMAHRKLNTSFLPDSTPASAKADIVAAAASETGAVAKDVTAQTTKRSNKETAKKASEALTRAEVEALRIRKAMEDMADDMERERKPNKKLKDVGPKTTVPEQVEEKEPKKKGPPTLPVKEVGKYEHREASYQATVEEVLALLEEERAEEVVVLDVRKKCNWTSYFVIASGRTGRQVEGMAEFIVKRLKEKRQKLLYDMDDSSSDWIALDLGEIVVHLMVPAVRKKYDLEGLWMKRPELSQSEMFRSMLAPDPEDNDDAYLPPEGTEESLSPQEAGITPEELKEVEELDDENDLKNLIRQEREAAMGLKKGRKGK